ncbi:protein of unknown function (plasmid) [Caballeronia sp. S22]
MWGPGCGGPVQNIGDGLYRQIKCLNVGYLIFEWILEKPLSDKPRWLITSPLAFSFPQRITIS